MEMKTFVVAVSMQRVKGNKVDITTDLFIRSSLHENTVVGYATKAALKNHPGFCVGHIVATCLDEPTSERSEKGGEDG